MKKLKIGLIACLACLALACCVALAACQPEAKTTYQLTWQPDEHVTVVAEGYDKLPTELEEGTEVTFTVTLETGWEISSVTPVTIKKDGEKYKFTVERDITIKVITKKIITSIDVTAPETLVYYAGETINPEDYTVTVNYQVGDPETTDAYTVAYQNGDAFSLGDTKFEIKYSGKSKEITLAEAVVGKITLKLNSGTLSAEELAKLPAEAALDTEKGEVTWTFAEAIAEDIALPEPILELQGGNLLLERWSGVENNKIAKGTVVSVTAVAVYESKMVEVKNMGFTTKEGVPYLVISGELIAGESAYLMLCEGNKVANNGANVKYDKLTYAEKKEGSNEFTLELNLAEMASATKENGISPLDPDEESTYNLKGPWLDLRFVVISGEKKIQQELFVSKDSTYANIDDYVIAKVGENMYNFSYKTWSPKAGDKITGGNGAEFTGEENILKLYYEDFTDVYTITNVSLEKRTVEEKEIVYYVISGDYYGNATSEAEMKTELEGVKGYLQNNDAANGAGWGNICEPENKIVEVDFSTKTYKVLLSLETATHGAVVYAHYTNKKDNNGNDLNVNFSNLDETPVTVGDLQYTLGVWTGWGSNLACCYVIDTTVPVLTVNSASIETDAEAEKVYFVLGGTWTGKTTKDVIESRVVNYDWQGTPYPSTFGWSGDWNRYKDGAVTLTATAEGTFTIKIDITSLNAYDYQLHLSITEEALPEGTNAPDFKPDIDSFESEAVMFGDKTYKLIYVKGSGAAENYYGLIGLHIAAAETPAPENPEPETPAEGEGE